MSSLAETDHCLVVVSVRGGRRLVPITKVQKSEFYTSYPLTRTKRVHHLLSRLPLAVHATNLSKRVCPIFTKRVFWWNIRLVWLSLCVEICFWRPEEQMQLFTLTCREVPTHWTETHNETCAPCGCFGFHRVEAQIQNLKQQCVGFTVFPWQAVQCVGFILFFQRNKVFFK